MEYLSCHLLLSDHQKKLSDAAASFIVSGVKETRPPNNLINIYLSIYHIERLTRLNQQQKTAVPFIISLNNVD